MLRTDIQGIIFIIAIFFSVYVKKLPILGLTMPLIITRKYQNMTYKGYMTEGNRANYWTLYVAKKRGYYL